MKNRMIVLKVWAWILLIVGIGIYFIGVFGGEFNRHMWLLFWGTSIEAMYLSVYASMFMLMAITVFIIAYCLNGRE